MVGEIEAAQQGLALAKETMPLVKEIIGMFKDLLEGMGGITNVATPTSVLTPATTAGPDALFAVAKSIDDVATALNRIAAALEKK